MLLERRPEPATESAASTETGYYVRGAVIEGIGENGNRIYTLNANRILQDPLTNGVAMEQVDLEYAVADSEPWRLQAQAGAIPDDGERIELRGDVRLMERLMAGTDPTTITTPSLDIDIVRNTAQTSESVTIGRGNYQLVATGLIADLKAQTLQLQSDVHGTFLP